MSAYNPIITHDVDRYYKWKYFKSIIGEFTRIGRGQSTWTYASAWRSFRNRKQKDPFSNLQQIAKMDVEAGLQSVFYIMTTREKHPKNINDYDVEDKEVSRELKAVLDIGAEIGLHAGYTTYLDPDKLLEQKNRLERVIDQKIVRNRQHYLKYEYPATFKLLQSVGIENDSSILVDLNDEQDPLKMSTYTMKNEDGSSLKISQTPLVFMDTHYMQWKDDELLSALERRLAPAKSYGGEVMILWHNNNISNDRETGLYKEALQVISAH